MAQITTSDIQTLIGFSIQNNKIGVIQAMNSSGYPVSFNISDSDLFNAVNKVYNDNGLSTLKVILNKVVIDKPKVSTTQSSVLTSKFQIVNPNQKSIGDWFNGAIATAGDLLGGHSTVVNTGASSTSKSPIEPWMMILLIVVGIVAIIILRKSKVAVIAIIAIVLSVVAYGIFARTTTTTGGTSTTNQTGSIGQSLLGLLGL